MQDVGMDELCNQSRKRVATMVERENGEGG